MAQHVRVFISYSHRDDTLRDKLRAHLSQLERDGLVQTWDDRAISAGGEWADEIDERLNQADVILLLVSADFIHSDYCYQKEMKRALERNAAEDDRAIVVPLILRKCDWQTAPFAKLQALPRDARPLSEWKTEDDYFEAVAKGLRKRIEALAEGTAAAVDTGDAVATDRVHGLGFVSVPVRAALLVLAVALIGGGVWWRAAASEVDSAIDEANVLLNVGVYGEAIPKLEPACARPWVGGRACFVLAKARLGAELEAHAAGAEAGSFLEGFERQLKALKARHPDDDPDLALFAGGLAMLKRAEGVREAITHFERALQLRPDFREAYYNLGAIHLMRARGADDYAQAEARFDQAVGQGEDAMMAPHYLNARAYSRLALGDVTGAETDYRRSADAGSIVSRVELAELLWRTGRYPAAADMQSAALERIEAGGLTGRNAAPWVFALPEGSSVVLKAAAEKACYVRLALQASGAVLGQAQAPELSGCGAQGTDIAHAVAWTLERAQGQGLSGDAQERASRYAQRLREVNRIAGAADGRSE